MLITKLAYKVNICRQYNNYTIITKNPLNILITGFAKLMQALVECLGTQAFVDLEKTQLLYSSSYLIMIVTFIWL